jgi:hypothetical protein
MQMDHFCFAHIDADQSRRLTIAAAQLFVKS